MKYILLVLIFSIQGAYAGCFVDSDCPSLNDRCLQQAGASEKLCVDMTFPNINPHEVHPAVGDAQPVIPRDDSGTRALAQGSSSFFGAIFGLILYPFRKHPKKTED